MLKRPCNSEVPPDSPVLIVGAGLVGSITAVALARAGIEVEILEKSAQLGVPGSDARALILSAASVEVLRGLGIWPRLVARATPVEEILIREAGHFGSVELRAEEYGLEALGWSCAADHLLAECRAAMLNQAGVKVHWSSVFTSRHLDGDVLAVGFDSNGTTHQRAPQLLIAADGTHSPTRAALSIGQQSFDYEQSALVCNLTVSRPRPHTAFEYFTESGPIAMLPLADSRYVSVQCLPGHAAEQAMNLGDDAYLAMLEQRFGQRLGRLSAPGPRRMHALVQTRASTITTVRAVVIGNAANTVHPNAAQGLNLGIRDIAALTQVLASATDVGAAEVLEDYAAKRRRDHARVRNFTDLLAQGFRSKLAPVAALRRLALGVLAVSPGLRHQLVHGASGLSALAGLTPDYVLNNNHE